MDCVVASDLGSSGCKTVVVDSRGRVLGEAQRAYATRHPRPGWAEQDPRDWLAAAIESTAQAVTASGVAPGRVAAYGLCGVTHNAVLADARGDPLRPSILLFDDRSQPQCEAIASRFGADVFRQALNDVSPIWTWPQLAWLRAHEPDVLQRTHHMVFQKDWVREQLAPSAPLTDTIDAAGSLLFDPVAECWIPEFVEHAGVPRHALPQVLRPTQTAGRLAESAAHAMRLQPGTPVIVGTTDTAAEVLGAGAVEPGQGTVKLASVGRITTVSSRPAPDGRLLNYRHVLDGLWYPGTASKYAASAYQWLHDAFGPGASFSQMSEQAEASPLGSRGVLFLAHLGGQWAPRWDPALRGAFVGLDSGHSQGDLCRAVMEGAAFALRDALDFARGEGLAFDELRLLGGGAASALWTQIVADVLDVPLVVPRERSAAWGAAVLTGIAAGLFPSAPQPLRRMMGLEARHAPRSEAVAAYEALRRIHREADQALAPVSRALVQWRSRTDKETTDA